MKYTNKIIYFFISIIFFIISDYYLSNQIILSLENDLTENPLIDLVYVQNTGAAFSILTDYNRFLLMFAIFSIILILLYTIKNIKKCSSMTIFFIAILVSGISCNLYERLAYGYVRDFFHLKFLNFPIFNISDVFINISVILLIITIIKNKWIKNDKTDN